MPEDIVPPVLPDALLALLTPAERDEAITVWAKYPNASRQRSVEDNPASPQLVDWLRGFLKKVRESETLMERNIAEGGARLQAEADRAVAANNLLLEVATRDAAARIAGLDIVIATTQTEAAHESARLTAEILHTRSQAVALDAQIAALQAATSLGHAVLANHHQQPPAAALYPLNDGSVLRAVLLDETPTQQWAVVSATDAAVRDGIAWHVPAIGPTLAHDLQQPPTVIGHIAFTLRPDGYAVLSAWLRDDRDDQ